MANRQGKLGLSRFRGDEERVLAWVNKRWPVTFAFPFLVYVNLCDLLVLFFVPLQASRDSLPYIYTEPAQIGYHTHYRWDTSCH